MKTRMIILFAFLCFQSINLFAKTINEVFIDFYDSPVIEMSRCGNNIQEFLKYLMEQKVQFTSGYVVSLHEPFAQLNHFDARWGFSERYQNGEVYSRSNWYFHVFLVIDGLVFDFSQNGKKIQLLKDYLEVAYVPKHTTKDIPMQGKLDAKKVYEQYTNLEMNIYTINDYLKDLGPTTYQGSFIELFTYAYGIPLVSEGLNSMLRTTYDEKIMNRYNGSYTFINPKMDFEGEQIPLKADPVNICRAFGFYGTLKNELKYHITNNQKMLKIYSYIRPKEKFNISTKDINISTSIEKTNGSIHRQPLVHFASSVTCSDLFTVFKSFSR